MTATSSPEPRPGRPIGLALLAAWAIALASGGCAPPEPPLTDRAALRSAGSIAVLPLADAPGEMHQDSGWALSSILAVQIAKPSVRDFREADVRSAFADAGFALDDRYDPAVAAAVGRKLGVDLVVCGEILHYDTQQELGSTRVLIISSSQTITTHWVSVSLRVVRAADGRIVYTGQGTAESPNGYSQAASEAAAQCFKSFNYIVSQK